LRASESELNANLFFLIQEWLTRRNVVQAEPFI